jgi:hypothetical protein
MQNATGRILALGVLLDEILAKIIVMAGML